MRLPCFNIGDASILEKNRQLAAKLGGPKARARNRRAGGTYGILADPQPLTPGTMIDVRIPYILGADLCSSYMPVRARVVYAGPTALVLEDSVAPLAGTMDEELRAMGEEFEATMLPVIRQYFGDPLAADPWLGNTGRIAMLFSPTVNGFGGVAGFVTAADFFPREACRSSNETQIFYARVPTRAGDGNDDGTVGDWRHSMTSTVIHEVKHITSYAERFAREATTLEETWLEESTARVAEELWGRTVFGYTHKGETKYRSSIYCEVRPGWPECGTRPIVMLKHMSAIASYLESTNELSPLGRANANDATFYGSDWLLVRWALDHHAQSEAGFLQALTQEPHLSGVQNLEARTGKEFAELLGPWSLSLYWDTPTAPGLSHPSWDLYDIFRGLNSDFPTSYPDAYPLRVWGPASYFTTDAIPLRGGSAAHFLIGTDQRSKQLLSLEGTAGGPPPNGLGIAVLRTQ